MRKKTIGLLESIIPAKIAVAIIVLFFFIFGISIGAFTMVFMDGDQKEETVNYIEKYFQK